MAMTKRNVTAIADAIYRTKRLIAPVKTHQSEWNEIRQKFRDSHIPEQYHELFDARCPQFNRT